MKVSFLLLFYFDRINWTGESKYLYKNGRSYGNKLGIKYDKRFEIRELRLIF